MASLVFALSLTMFAGCVNVPHRPYLNQVAGVKECGNGSDQVPDGAASTPHIDQAKGVTIHFIEFDDQGWAYPNPTTGDTNRAWRPGYQMDCAIQHLITELEKAKNSPRGTVKTIVYIHGWHHSAKDGDRDVKRFKELLEQQARVSDAKIIGYYIGWNGDTLDFPLLRQTTFWGRKNAAHHVSEGSVREFFSRFKAIRNYYNNPENQRTQNCGKPEAATIGNGCLVQTLMIGHSFGGWILFAATSPYIMETLAGTGDFPDHVDMKGHTSQRERGIADMVVLLNPAFEASRYEPIHRAARRYHHHVYEAPILVSVTSTADRATKNAFPIARFFNSIFQYPATTDEESVAMKRTHGHIDAYLTHELHSASAETCLNNDNTNTCGLNTQSTCDDQALRRKFFESASSNVGLHLNQGWKREMCTNLTLVNLEKSDLSPYSIVWNVRTFQEVVPGHNDIMGNLLHGFLSQIYGDILNAPRLRTISSQ